MLVGMQWGQAIGIRIVEKPFNWLRFGAADAVIAAALSNQHGTQTALLRLSLDATDVFRRR